MVDLAAAIRSLASYPDEWTVRLGRREFSDEGSLLIDVQENIKTIEKQLINAEKKLNLSGQIARPELWDEEGLPLTEIREELDEDGNVICKNGVRLKYQSRKTNESL